MPLPATPLSCQQCAIRHKGLCAELTPLELTALNAVSRRRTFGPGQMVVMEGEPDVFGNVLSGLLVEKKSLPDGREQIVSLLFPSDFHGNPRTAKADTTIHAIANTELCLFERQSFERLSTEIPTLQRALLDRSLASLQHARDWMLLLGQKSASERVATFLLRIAERQAELDCHHHSNALSDGDVIEIPITRAQIAAYVGLTIETVSRRLTALRDAQIIDLEGSRTVRLINIMQLRAAAGTPPTLN